MLIIVNPYATTVSDRLKNLVVYALQGRYEVEAVSTEAQNHATEIGREAIDGGYDLVVAFGGDGTLNEVANGLAGTDVPVTILPGGSTNVVARTLGIPNDVVDATEHLLGLADRFEPRRIDLGIANGRRFVFSCGCGLDASAAMRVDRKPKLKARAGPYFYTAVAVSSLLSRIPAPPGRDAPRDRRRADRGGHRPLAELRSVHLLRPPAGPRLRGHRDRRRHALGRHPAPRRAARHGARSSPACSPRACAPRATARSPISTTSPRRAWSSASLDAAGVARPFPIQVDGDFIGAHAELDLAVDPGALTVVA